jgi:hypothetical protein
MPEYVPSFFQDYSEIGLRRQAKWLRRNVGLDDLLLGSVLGMPHEQIGEWRTGARSLSTEQQECLGDLWRLNLRLRGIYNCDDGSVKQLLFYVAPDNGSTAPWSGDSVISYIGKKGHKGINDVKRWFDMLRFGNPAEYEAMSNR